LQKAHAAACRWAITAPPVAVAVVPAVVVVRVVVAAGQEQRDQRLVWLQASIQTRKVFRRCLHQQVLRRAGLLRVDPRQAEPVEAEAVVEVVEVVAVAVTPDHNCPRLVQRAAEVFSLRGIR
jgi:hypothetical protein